VISKNMLHFLSIFAAGTRDPLTHGGPRISGSLLMAGETVAVFMSGDDTRDDLQLSIATPLALAAAVNFNSLQ